MLKVRQCRAIVNFTLENKYIFLKKNEVIVVQLYIFFSNLLSTKNTNILFGVFV